MEKGDWLMRLPDRDFVRVAYAKATRDVATKEQELSGKKAELTEWTSKRANAEARSKNSPRAGGKATFDMNRASQKARDDKGTADAKISQPNRTIERVGKELTDAKGRVAKYGGR